MLETIILIGVLFTMVSIIISQMQVTSAMSLQTYCVSNLRSLYLATNDYRLEQKSYPGQYPGFNFPELYTNEYLTERTFGCVAYDKIGGDSDDDYSDFYIRPRDDMPEALFLIMEADEGTGEHLIDIVKNSGFPSTTVTVTSGKAFGYGDVTVNQEQ